MLNVIKSKSNTIGILLIMLSFMMAAMYGIANANAIRASSIGERLGKLGISCDSVSLDEKVLKVELLSEGIDKCTLDDLKALQTVYSTVHGKDYLDKIDDLHINFVSQERESIYGFYLSSVTAKAEDAVSLSYSKSIIEPEQARSDLLAILDSRELMAESVEISKA
ncbi:MAG: hypothetical protein LBC41_13975, partial [Clostridiales bacterium]|nr:hypothetical protein [Clostridiales bacterium]